MLLLSSQNPKSLLTRTTHSTPIKIVNMIPRLVLPHSKTAARAISAVSTTATTPVAVSTSHKQSSSLRSFHHTSSSSPTSLPTKASSLHSKVSTAQHPQKYQQEQQKRFKSAAATSTYDLSLDGSSSGSFPSIVIGPDKSIQPQGSFAQAQAEVRKATPT